MGARVCIRKRLSPYHFCCPAAHAASPLCTFEQQADTAANWPIGDCGSVLEDDLQEMKPKFPTARELEETAAVMRVLASATGPLSVDDIARSFAHGKSIEKRVKLTVAALSRLGHLSSSDAGKMLALRRVGQIDPRRGSPTPKNLSGQHDRDELVANLRSKIICAVERFAPTSSANPRTQRHSTSTRGAALRGNEEGLVASQPSASCDAYRSI